VLQASEAFDEILFHLMIIAENLNDFSRLRTVAAQINSMLEFKSARPGAAQRVLVAGSSSSSPVATPRAPSPASAISVGTTPSLTTPRSVGGGRADTAAAGAESAGSTDSASGIRLSIASVSEGHGDAPEDELAVSQPWLAMRDLSILCKGAALVRGLNVELTPHSRLLVTGESGVGKTTLLRAIQGLHWDGSGQVRRPPAQDALFIPQRPYMTLGTLREQLLYPDPPACRSDRARDGELVDALRLVGLEAVLERCGAAGLDAEERWADLLSVGEQQRLAFARLVLLRPTRRFVFLDESTSACDLASERRMYALLAANCTAWVSIGHRASIERFHDLKLVLQRDGAWDLHALAEE
jgi:ABC-type multidrug transport system fused ATPase/permease subunit